MLFRSKHAGGGAGKNSEEWLYTTNKNARNFIRKWGHFVKHDPLMKPIIPPLYDIGFIVKNCNMQALEILEPWCSTIYFENYNAMAPEYIKKEQPNTLYGLIDRLRPYDNEKNNEILVSFDASKLTQSSFQIIQQLPEIIKDSGEIGVFELDIFNVEIIQINEYQNSLIVN